MGFFKDIFSTINERDQGLSELTVFVRAMRDKIENRATPRYEVENMRSIAPMMTDRLIISYYKDPEIQQAFAQGIKHLADIPDKVSLHTAMDLSMRCIDPRYPHGAFFHATVTPVVMQHVLPKFEAHCDPKPEVMLEIFFRASSVMDEWGHKALLKSIEYIQDTAQTDSRLAETLAKRYFPKDDILPKQAP